MTIHWEAPPEPIPDDWTLKREAILFYVLERVESGELRAASDDLPAAFNTESVYRYADSHESSIIGYAVDHGDYNEGRAQNRRLDASMDHTSGVWNGMWNNLLDMGFPIDTWYKLERYETGEVIDTPPWLDPIPVKRDFLYELPQPPSQQN